MSTLAEVHYTVEVPRRGAIRKTKVVRARAEQLPAAVERACAKLAEVGAYQVVVRYEVTPAAAPAWGPAQASAIRTAMPGASEADVYAAICDAKRRAGVTS